MTQNSNIRRIDDLGRIVIPKDIRKKLHIKESEPLEIFIEGEEIKIKKYSSLPDVRDYIKSLLDIGSRITSNEYIITDRGKVIAATVPELEGSLLNEKLEEVVLSCTEKKNAKDSFEIASKIITAYTNVLPIIVDNDRTGLIIEYNEDRELNSSDVIRIYKCLIENQLNNY